MAVIIACVLALGVSTGLLLWTSRQRAGRPLAVCGLALLLASGVGVATLWGFGAATNLTLIVIVPALLLALAEAALSVRGVHWFWRLLVHGVVIFATMVFEWRRGDLFASGAVMATVVGVLGFNVVVFAVGGAQRSGAYRTPVVLGLLGTLYLLVIASGLPNPGLQTLLLVLFAALLPLLIWTPAAGTIDRAVGPVLAGLACAVGYYAWLGNASPTMVIAPLLVVGVDVGWTLVARLVTRDGRARLGAAGNWWKGVDAWATPADDLVAQRAAASGSVRAAALWLIGASVLVLAISLLQWRLTGSYLVALAPLVVVALGWLALQWPWAQSSLRNLLIALGVVAVVALVGAAGGYRLDGRLVIAALPVLAGLAVAVAAGARMLKPYLPPLPPVLSKQLPDPLP